LPIEFEINREARRVSVRGFGQLRDADIESLVAELSADRDAALFDGL